MIKTLNNTIKQDRTAYKIPRSVQDVIPIQRIFADGIFQFGTKYSRTLRFSDINYAIASKEDKTAMFLGYSELLNALDSGSTTKLTICNKQVNRQAFEDTVLLPQRGDNLDGFVDEFNGMLEGKISGSSASVEQERFITVSVHKKNVDEARTFFSRVTGEVSSKLSRLNSSSNELDAAERLDVLRGFFRPEEAALPFDLQSAMKRGHNLKDTICPDSLEFHRDYFKMGSQYGRVLFLKDYASYIKDSMILELTDLNRRMMLSIDMLPVPPAAGIVCVLDQSGWRLVTYFRDDIEMPDWAMRYLRSLETEKTPVLPLSAYRAADCGGAIVGFSFHDHYTRLDDLHAALLQLDGVNTVYYADTYREGYMFLECGAADAGKGAGAKAARDLAGADRLDVFGDNFNDLDMYRVADMSFAPVSGEPEMQKIASRVIPSINDGGGIQTIRAYFCGGADGAAETE